MKISVLGAGSWGTTVAALAARNHPTTLWARDLQVVSDINQHHQNKSYLKGFDLPDRLGATEDLEEACASADVLVVGIPSASFRQVLTDTVPHVRPWIPVVSLTKGLEMGSQLRMTEVIEEVLPGHAAAALTGPNLAKEILAGQAAASVIATQDMSVAALLQEVFAGRGFRVYRNHDVAGCELGGALKNVIAIATGIAEGLGVGDNTRAMVITRGLAELTRLGVAMGGEAATFAGLAGMGDLMATCMSPQSRNRYVGEQLGKGRALQEILDEMNMVAEGVKTAAMVQELSAKYAVDMRVCSTISKVISGEIRADQAFDGLRNAQHEMDQD